MKKEKLNIGRNIRRIFVRRKYKDVLFKRVFQDKKDLLTLYNALNHTQHDNPDDLEITTLEDAIYLSMKNDVSFIISSTLNLYEHQSSVNPNMPLRGVMYLARLYEAYVKKQNADIYGSKLIQLPLPVYVVFYNGLEKMEEEQELLLSAAFANARTKHKDMVPALECKVRVLNINYGHNEEIMKDCIRLHDYAFFINRVRENTEKRMKLETAIEEAIDYCIEHEILSDILTKQKTEVVSMLLTEYDKKLHDKTLREDGYEDGFNDGFGNGLLRRLIELVCKKVSKGYSLELIADALEEEVETIRPIYEEAMKQKPNFDIDLIMAKIR